ncbi:hypothetical protein XELAEV_18037364mg [Xenopus laevis]|uniref:Reverse transcriptase domain-containing protein n=1 Tax=Xenopus laevis TaxID=8355 RepID=A0A974HA47_XENLA|nr:hypothetical protein XELAEV_18037364mg [Xenopus laevis]
MDVESLYTNIPHEDGIAACQHFLEINHMPTIYSCILTHNYFSLGDAIYLQLMGSAMGSKMAPHQALKYNRICANLDDRNKHLHSLRKTLVNQGYHPQVIDDKIHRATQIPRDLHLDYKEKTENNRQAPNLRKMIVRSALPKTTKAGTFPCNSNRCETCKYILCKDQVAIPNTQKVYTILDHYLCASSNVVYMITCTRCSTGGIYMKQDKNCAQGGTITDIKSTPN